MQRLPHFYILGAQRCGTTWLATCMRQHPQLFIPKQKELHYYCDERRFARGTRWYSEQFSGAQPHQSIGEATPNYLAVTHSAYAQTLPRLRALTPDARFIVVLRDPVARAISCVPHLVRLGILPIWTDPDSYLARLLDGASDTYGVLEFGYYHRQLQQYWAAFSRDRFLVLRYEDELIAALELTLPRIWRFLGVEQTFKVAVANARRNAAVRSRLGLCLSRLPPRELTAIVARKLDGTWLAPALRISAQTRAGLLQHFAREKRDVCDALGWSPDVWAV